MKNQGGICLTTKKKKILMVLQYALLSLCKLLFILGGGVKRVFERFKDI